MASLWKNAYNHWKPWSRCSTCGQSWPSQKIAYNPRFGWQCPPCWDGFLQHDQYETPIFPYEGTRRVNSPIVNSLTEGIAPGSLLQTYIYNFRDRYTGQIWLVRMTPLEITAGGQIVFTTTSLPTLTLGENTLEPIFDGMMWTNAFDLFVGNGVLLTEPYNPLSELSINMAKGICDFGPVASVCTVFMVDQSTSLIYSVDFSVNPPTITLSADQTVSAFDSVEIGNGFFALLSGSLFSTTTPPPGPIFTNPCITENPEVVSPIIPPVPPVVVSCPDAVVSSLSVDFTEPVPSSVFPITNYHWDFGDGTTADTGTTNTVHHDYASFNIYTVFVTVSFSDGSFVGSGACPVEVEGLTGVVVLCPDTVINFLDVAFTEPAPSFGTPTNYHWDFGDGTSTDTGATNTVSHTYAADGTYLVIVTISVAESGLTFSSGGCPMTLGIPPFCACWTDPTGAAASNGGVSSTELLCNCALQVGSTPGWVLWGGTVGNCFPSGGNTNVTYTLVLSVSPNPDCSAPVTYTNTLSISTQNTAAPYHMNSVTAVAAGSFITIKATVQTTTGNRGDISELFANFYTVEPANPGNPPGTQFPCIV